MRRQLPIELVINVHKFCDIDTRRTLEQISPSLRSVRHRLRTKPDIQFQTDVYVGIITPLPGDGYFMVNTYTPTTISWRISRGSAAFEYKVTGHLGNGWWDGTGTIPFDEAYWAPWLEAEALTGKRHILRALRVLS